MNVTNLMTKCMCDLCLSLVAHLFLSWCDCETYSKHFKKFNPLDVLAFSWLRTDSMNEFYQAYRHPECHIKCNLKNEQREMREFSIHKNHFRRFFVILLLHKLFCMCEGYIELGKAAATNLLAPAQTIRPKMRHCPTNRKRIRRFSICHLENSFFLLFCCLSIHHRNAAESDGKWEEKRLIDWWCNKFNRNAL